MGTIKFEHIDKAERSQIIRDAWEDMKNAQEAIAKAIAKLTKFDHEESVTEAEFMAFVRTCVDAGIMDVILNVDALRDAVVEHERVVDNRDILERVFGK